MKRREAVIRRCLKIRREKKLHTIKTTVCFSGVFSAVLSLDILTIAS